MQYKDINQPSLYFPEVASCCSNLGYLLSTSAHFILPLDKDLTTTTASSSWKGMTKKQNNNNYL